MKNLQEVLGLHHETIIHDDGMDDEDEVEMDDEDEVIKKSSLKLLFLIFNR